MTTPDSTARSDSALGGWLPIETAPKDGRFVILHVHGAEPEVSIGFYDGGPDWLFVEGDIMPTECRPLFWQPLPEPPTPQNHLQHKG